MISFIWPPGEPMLAGTGGSETFTAGHIRELLRRGIAAQVVSVGHGIKDGRQDFSDIPFLALPNQEAISELHGTVVFVNRSYPVPTKQKAIIILHCAIPRQQERDKYRKSIVDKIVIATSVYSGQQWALYLDVPFARINIVMPFADPIFSNVARAKPTRKTRILFAGRLHPEKGIYTLLEMMHQKDMQHNGFTTTIVTAGQHVEIGREIARMLKDYPYAKLIPAQKTVPSIAKLLARSDILLMPSVFAEPFGMLSVEAQHAGCRVVASNVGGLPETNCGLLTLVDPRSPHALLTGIKQAVALGLSSKKDRNKARGEFTLAASVDSFLRTIPSH
ncbi:MAG TPA: glycosyltransferase family 4 protein [Candidatus Saccharimonadales bacterium]|nr:glycosyltransferase family 4 protein [Candidatus Saccharimonadales bacterium]